jgi:phospho-N-acetylmuramoyl-pentapeptide-transferase
MMGINIGLWFIPFFILVTLLMYSGGVIDGIDGLAGGVFAIIFATYSGIAFFQNQINLAAFCAVIVGSILAFLWFNIPPARFYMSETGSMALTITLAIVAFMTDSMGEGRGIIVLPIIAFPLIITTISVVLQMLSKKIRGKKIFLVAPLHHHFEAKGWPAYKVTMRYWIVSLIFAIFGLILAFIK